MPARPRHFAICVFLCVYIKIFSECIFDHRCSLMNVTEPRYVTGFEMLDTSNFNLVHHAEILLCQGQQGTETEPRRCGAYNYRYEMECALIVALASGTEVNFPYAVHYLLEPGVYNVEVHFDLFPVATLDQSTFGVSGSGLRAYLEPEPRAMSMSILRMEVGEFSIPPNLNEYHLSFAMHGMTFRNYSKTFQFRLPMW